MRCQEEILPFYTAATIISQALQEHTSWASWALNIGIWPIVNIIKKVQSWQLVYINNQNLTENLPKFCDSSPMMSLILLFWSGDCQAKRSPSLHFVPMYLKYIFIPFYKLTIFNNIMHSILKDKKVSIDKAGLHWNSYPLCGSHRKRIFHGWP